MSKAFVYTEMQFSVPFNKAPWRELNPLIRAQPGFVNKTWLSGFQNNSVGGIYEFDSIENASRFAHCPRLFSGRSPKNERGVYDPSV
jgi:hypothetical protein